ncbi:hypothetical protein QBC32DRAFT_113140 [Pseudoneurospora amorphoporcata]|uniref:BHLH domain-containing protein n=1 Tax=Pseudoneurospora amorphoporcata TaxID=241081 RepID=A0AAN6SHR3_9PEZI|nr:hypothetical protein QBC32DRAFT_113140 [Pseudoneurospora amorphoporcata]
MADPDADSPGGLFQGGLDNFDISTPLQLGEPTLAHHGSLNGNVNDAVTTPDPTSQRGTSIPSSLADTTRASTGGPTQHNSPPIGHHQHPNAFNGNGISPQQQYQQQQQQQQAFDFTQDNIANWALGDSPPLDPGSDFNFGPVPHGLNIPQSWDLPVHFGLPQQGQQQQQQQQGQFYPDTTGAGIDPGIYAAALSIPSPQGHSAEPISFRTNINPNIRNKLTPAQQERLKTIAMPPHLQYHSPKSAGSPDSNASMGHDKGSMSSPDGLEPSKLNSRKRKSSAEVDEDDDDDDMDGHQPVKKTAHNMIEKRYRTNLNDKIAALRDSVPALRIMSKSARGEDTTEDREELHGLTPAHKLNKATVLSKATEYIRHLEKRNSRLIEEKTRMEGRIAAFEKLFMAGAMTGMTNPMQAPPTPIQYPQDVAAFMSTPMHTPRGPDPPGLIPIPDDMKRILSAQQMNAGRPYPVGPPAMQPGFVPNPGVIRRQQIQQQQQQHQMQGRWNPYLGKMMVGSLAGLMLVEAFMEDETSNETTEGRGLYALPLRLIGSFIRSSHLSVGGYYISAIEIMAKLKLLLLGALLVWTILPDNFFDAPKSEKPKGPTTAVEAVPSLASPIHVRRQAWLTAIQTVWVPRHNFLLEAAALLLKTLKFTLRNVFGDRTYLWMAGLSEEQEAARVKAWTIALDAQLAGGDVEINRSRLTLTLLASGTLPETPLRLMLKALHTRVLLWQFSGKFSLANIPAAKIARSRWNEARQLNLILQRTSTNPEDVLPEHLATLLEQDCDVVLNNSIVQRAHNLAFNRPTTFNLVDQTDDGMNIVVEDPAVRSPMDAVAAWYSSSILQRVLLSSLAKAQDGETEATKETIDEIALAVKIAPIGSNAYLRALVARAVLVSEKRGVSIATALKASDPSLNPDKHPEYGRGVPPLIDSPMAQIVPDHDALMTLQFAMRIAHLQKSANPPKHAIEFINSILPDGTDQPKHEGMSLLACTAAYHLMELLERHTVCREQCSGALERLAGALRIWVGSSQGEKVGLDTKMRQKMIARCLSIKMSLMGMENESGYGSMSECEERAEGGC